MYSFLTPSFQCCATGPIVISPNEVDVSLHYAPNFGGLSRFRYIDLQSFRAGCEYREKENNAVGGQPLRSEALTRTRTCGGPPGDADGHMPRDRVCVDMLGFDAIGSLLGAGPGVSGDSRTANTTISSFNHHLVRI